MIGSIYEQSHFSRGQLLELLLWWERSCIRHYLYVKNLESFECYESLFARQHYQESRLILPAS